MNGYTLTALLAATIVALKVTLDMAQLTVDAAPFVALVLGVGVVLGVLAGFEAAMRELPSSERD